MRPIRNLALALSLGLAVVAGGAALAGPARADDQSALEKLLVESATTPAQHKALAEYYTAKAKALKEEAADHRAMAKSYSGAKFASAQQMTEHCNKLASLADAQAAEYEQLASMHAAAAK